jgi:hypothetical protein
MSCKGIIATRIIEGAANKQTFLDFFIYDVVRYDTWVEFSLQRQSYTHCTLVCTDLKMVTLQIPHLNPLPNAESVVVMDNCRIHDQNELTRLAASMGADMVFLPPYSPIYNPIEKSFSTYKQWLKTERNLISVMDPIEAIQLGMDAIGTAKNGTNWIRSTEIYDC